MSANAIKTICQTPPAVSNNSQSEFDLFAWIDEPVPKPVLPESQPHTVGDSELLQEKVYQKPDHGMPDKNMSKQQVVTTAIISANGAEMESDSFALAACPMSSSGAKKNNKKACQKCNHLNGNRSHKCKQCGHKFIIKNEGMKSADEAKHARWLASNAVVSKRKRGRPSDFSKKKKRKMAPVTPLTFEPSSASQLAVGHRLPVVEPSSASQLAVGHPVDLPPLQPLLRASSFNTDLPVDLPPLQPLLRASSFNTDLPADLPQLQPLLRISSFNTDFPVDSFQFDAELLDFDPVDDEPPFIFGNLCTFDECFNHAPEITV